MSTCQQKSATAINTSLTQASRTCDAPDIRARSPHWGMRSSNTSRDFSIALTATGERDGRRFNNRRTLMFDFEHRLSEAAAQTVLCIGDLMLDDFVYGDVSRISPEAPAPVITVNRQEVVIGGAGNVARNIASLGARCLFVGVVGDDDGGRAVRAALATEPNIEASLVIDRSRPTTRKVRFVSEHHSTHLLRADWEVARPIDAEREEAVIAHVLAMLPRASAVVLSDYAKGVLTPRVIRAVIEAAARLA